MAINNDEKINISGTYVRNLDGAKIVDGKEVEGGYFVCDSLPSWGTVGQLCYCTGTASKPVNKFYQYNGNSWEEAKLGNPIPDEKIGTLLSLLAYVEIV